MADTSLTPNPGPPKKTARIYAMPEKFYLEDKGGGGRNTFLIVAIIVLVIALLGGGAYFFLQKYAQPENNANTNALVNVNTVTNITNANKNVNNANKNANTAVNINKAANSNVANLNLFANTNANTNTLANVNMVVPSSQDTDTDGLTDAEESLFGTGISTADSDGDGYADGQEVGNGYDPLGSGRIATSTAIRSYTDGQEGYLVLYPAAWTPSDDPQNTRAKMFTTNGEFVEVSVQENSAKLSARDWYLTKSPGIDSARVLSVSNWEKSLSGALSLDGLTVYYTKGDKAYVVTYNINILSQANYKTTFQMMYRSFTLTGAVTNTNNTTNVNRATNTNTTSNGNTNTITNNTNQSTNTNANTNGTSNYNSNRL